MSIFIIAAVVRENSANYGAEKIKRRVLRDNSNPLSMPDSLFVAQYRLNKEAFNMVLVKVKPFLDWSSIPPILQLATTLRFLAEGSYQRAVGKDSNISLGRSTVSKVLSRVLNVLESKLCQKWIRLNVSDNEVRKCKRHFYEKFKLPGVRGCIDGTHVRLIKPVLDAPTFYNRKGYYSLNAMIICDHNLIIQAVDATHPGSSHDSFIWKLSRAFDYFSARYQAGDHSSYLSGDAGYAIEPFLLTPYRDTALGSMEHKFNCVHASARNVVERTIGVLKARFRWFSALQPKKSCSNYKRLLRAT